MKKILLSFFIVLSMTTISCRLVVPDEVHIKDGTVTIAKEEFPAPVIVNIAMSGLGNNYYIYFNSVPNAVRYIFYIRGRTYQEVKELNHKTANGRGSSASSDLEVIYNYNDDISPLPVNLFLSFQFGIRAVSCDGVQSAITWYSNFFIRP